MIAHNEVAVALNQKLLAVGTTGVLKVSYLSRQISDINVAQAGFPANFRRTHQGLRTGIVRVGHLVVFVKRRGLPGNVWRHTCNKCCKPVQFVIRVIEAGNHERNNFQPEAHFVQAPNCVQDGLQTPAKLVIVAVIKTLQINFVEVNPGSQVLKHLRGAVPVGDKGRQQPCCTGLLEDCHRPFAGYQRLVVGAHQNLGALLKSLLHQLIGGGSQRGTNRGRVTERLGRYPILAIGTVQVTAQHSEAVRQCAGIGVEEWLLLDRVALHYTGVSPGNVQSPASVVANLADARLALWDGAAVTTGKTAYPVAVKPLVKLTLADILVNDIP